MMALFPAFSDEVTNKTEDSHKALDWLNNKSFQTQDALSLHCRFLENVGTQDATESREASSVEDVGEEGDKVPHKKKRKKSEKKKKKKHKKRSVHTDSSGSDSEIIFPSDLKKKQDIDRPENAALASNFLWLDDLTSSQKERFCVDRKPDPSNWTYKSLYRGDVARYRRKGTSLFGHDPLRQGVTWDESDSKKKHRGKDRRMRGGGGCGEDRYFSKSSRQELKAQSPTLLLPSTPENDISKGQAFLALCDEGKTKDAHTNDRLQNSSLNPLGVYDASTALWMQGKGKPEEMDHKQSTQTTELSSLATKKTEDFNKRLREQPEDTALWMQFIHYQDELNTAAFGGEQDHQGSDHTDRLKSSYGAVLEKKLSIADRAVAANPSSISLQLERLKLCQELWESSALAKEWKKLVFIHPNSAPLWKEYLLFMQSYFSNFSVSKVNSAYGKCLSTLSAVRDGSMVSHPALPGIEEDMLDIFIQQCHFLRQAGHSEKATSLFQAMLEFTFLKPESLQKIPTRQQVEFFETFWDSGEARVGEPGAKGWKTWMHQQERGGWLQPSTEEEEDEDEEEEIKDRKQPRWRVWLDVESSREAANWLPWRPDKSKGQSEEDCEDPDRQVLFDDIGQSMIVLSSPELQLRFLLHFLSFLGLPANMSNKSGMLLENISLLTKNGNLTRPLTFAEFLHSGTNSVGQMTTLQGTPKYIGLGKQGERFLNNVFAVIQPVLPVQCRAILSLCRIQYGKLKVEQSISSGNKKRIHSQGKKSKRTAKYLLKEPENRSSLELWREYAHLEWLLGNLEEARKVFGTAAALGGAKALSSQSLCNLTLLWAQLETESASDVGGRLKDVTTTPAVCILTRLAEGAVVSSSQPLSPVSILKARKSYDQALNRTLCLLEQVSLTQDDKGKDSEQVQSYRGLVGCYALFQYLTVGIKSAADVYSLARNRMEKLQQRLRSEKMLGEISHAHGETDCTHISGCFICNFSSECEALAIQQTALLKYHNNVSVFPLAELRQMLTSTLSVWPCCAALWNIYIQVENRYHSAGRARRFFHSVIRNANNVLPSLFAIVAEQQRKETVDAALRLCCHGTALPTLPENGLSHRIRGLFENATKTKMGAHCSLLWRMYMYFLISDGKVDQAKGIFYKALQNVPWSKGLYMDAVQLFPEHLQEFVDLMTEKELRLRLPLEELDILLED